MTKSFSRFARNNRIGDDELFEAVVRAEAGLIDADLGGGVIKQRIARPGKGRSSGHRTLIAFRSGDRSTFVYGFSKNERGNVSTAELAALKLFAADLLSSDEREIDDAIAMNRLIEIVWRREDEG